MSGLVGAVESLLLGLAGRRRKASLEAAPNGAASPPGFLIGTALPFGSAGPEPGTPVFLSENLLSMHVALYGSSGSGKSTLLRRLRRHSYGSSHSVFDLDFLGDSADLEIRQLAAMAEGMPEVAMIDARQTDRVAELNVLGGPGSPHARSSAFVRALGAEADGLGVRVRFNALAASVALSELGYGITEFQPLLSVDPAFRRHVLDRLSDEASRAALEDFDRQSAELKRAHWMEIANKLNNFLFAPELRLMFGQRGFPDFGRLIDKPSHVTLVALGAARQPAASLVAKTLISALERHVMARSDLPEERRQATRLIIDEASRVSGFGLESLLAEGRRMHCSLILAMQFTQQAEPALREAMRANCSTQVIFAAGGSQATELASEIACDVPREKVRETLISLNVGCAMVVRRGAPPVVVRMPDSPVPRVGEREVNALRERALAQTGVARDEAVSVMRKRSDWISSLRSSTQTEGQIVHLRRPSGRSRADD